MRKRRLLVSIDLERDIPRYLRDSFLGVEQAIPSLLELLKDTEFVPDLFVEATVASRYPLILTQAARRGSYLACHGDHIDPLLASQLRGEILEAKMRQAKRSLELATGRSPVVYREANFAVNVRSLVLLSRCGFLVDSSVLPNRCVRKYGIWPLVDHRGAPVNPYRPDATDHANPGNGAILEIPVTSNPLNEGGPIGAGYLNWKGVDHTLKALCESKGDPVTFLIHPWECVDLTQASDDLPGWLLAICKENTKEMANLLEQATSSFSPASLASIAAEFGVKLS